VSAPLPPGSSFLVRVGVRAALWFVRRPFLMRTPLQLVVCGFALAGAVALAAGVGVRYGIPLLILALLLAIGRGYLAWLTRGADPVVLVSRFKSPSGSGQDAAASHADALRRFLDQDPDVTSAGPFSVRTIDVPLSEASARRLLRSLPSELVGSPLSRVGRHQQRGAMELLRDSVRPDKPPHRPPESASRGGSS
jgi:hypothetical protein